jgi:hypothetical protein
MSRRAGLYLSYFLLFAACIYGAGCDGCAGTPAGFNKVSLATPTPVILQGGSAVITASVANDPGSSAGVSWTLTGAGSLASATTSSVTYDAPATVTAETVVTIHASAVDFPSQITSIQITVEPPVAISTTTLAAGNYGSPYTATVNATGGVPPFSWSISGGSLTPGLQLGTSSSNSVIISGTPTQQVNSNFTIRIADSTGGVSTEPLTISIGPPLPLAVSTTTPPAGTLNVSYPATTLQATGGVPPFSWVVTSGQLPPGLNMAGDGAITGTPTLAGTYPFTVQVTDSENPAMTATGSFSITVSNVALMNGNYAFELNGFTSAGNATSVAGTFTADGQGHITSGVEDVNTIGSTPKNQTFTGTFMISGDNQGLLTFSSLPGTPAYSFTINGDGSRGRLIEFDASGTRGSGDLELRSVPTCTATTFNGNYAFGLVGQQIAVSGVSAAGPDVIVGSFTAAGAVSGSAQGSLGPGELDANTPVKVTIQDKSVAGTYKATSQATRCSMILSSTVQTMNFSVYPVSSFESFVVETDTVSATAPILTAGTIQQQTGAPFTGAPGSTFSNGQVVVGALTGRAPIGNSYVPDVAVVAITGTGTSSFTMNAVENQAGTVPPPYSFSANFQEADTYGRVSTNIIQPFGPTFYMISQNTAFCIGEDESQTSQPYPFFGVFQPQATGPFTPSTIASVFVQGTGAPAEAAGPDTTGAAEFINESSTGGEFGALEDQSTSQANTPGVDVAGTYTISSATLGTGTISFSQPATASGAFLIVSPSEVLMITTTTGDANPVVEIFEQ